MNAWMPAEPPFDPESFSGVGRLFPLPQVAAFPHVVTALHVFEPRYLTLTAEALSDDGLITMAVLKPGWEPDYAGRPPVEEFGCLGKVISHHTDQDGKYNLLLLGLRRVRLGSELHPPQAFRRAALQLIPEMEPPADDQQQPLRDALIAALRQRVTSAALSDELRLALAQGPRLGAVADLAAHSLPLAAGLKQRLLGEGDALVRSQLILDAIGGLPVSEAEFPPPFSLN